MSDISASAVFENARSRLLGLAYRILGSRADAEDAVQDTYLKWRTADHAAIEGADAWLTTACTRRCIDLLRSAHRSRTEYVGSWLPEPVLTPDEDTPEAQLSLSSSLTTAFLLLLERLTPKERAAYLLREIFDMPYGDVAATLDIQEPACRKLVSRAKVRVEAAQVRHATPANAQRRLLAAFQSAIASGNPTALAGLLSQQVELSADGGGKVSALAHVLHGESEVLSFISKDLHRYWTEYEWDLTGINGSGGIVLRKDGHAMVAVSFAYDADGLANGIYIVRNPDKLARLDQAFIA
jgi:RNA polymerase sigma factor (sigma-70 family)